MTVYSEAQFVSVDVDLLSGTSQLIRNVQIKVARSQMLQIDPGLEGDVSVVEERLRNCHDHPVLVDPLGESQTLGYGDEVHAPSHVVHALHVEQHSDNAVGAVLGQRVRQVVGRVLDLRAASLRIRDVRSVAVVEVTRGARLGRSVALPLALAPALSTRINYMVTNTLYPETELRDAADRGKFLCELLQHLEVFLRREIGLDLQTLIGVVIL